MVNNVTGRDCHASVFFESDTPSKRKVFVTIGGTDENFGYLEDECVLILGIILNSYLTIRSIHITSIII